MSLNRDKSNMSISWSKKWSNFSKNKNMLEAKLHQHRAVAEERAKWELKEQKILLLKVKLVTASSTICSCTKDVDTLIPATVPVVLNPSAPPFVVSTEAPPPAPMLFTQPSLPTPASPTRVSSPCSLPLKLALPRPPFLLPRPPFLLPCPPFLLPLPPLKPTFPSSLVSSKFPLLLSLFLILVLLSTNWCWPSPTLYLPFSVSAYLYTSFCLHSSLGLLSLNLKSKVFHLILFLSLLAACSTTVTLLMT